MFDLFKKLRGKVSGETDETYSLGKYSCIQCSEDGRTLVINLDNSKWTVEGGGAGHERLTVSPPGGIEVFDMEELLRQVDKLFRSLARGSTVDRLLKRAIKEDESTVVMVLPASGEARFNAYEKFEDFLKRRFKTTSKSLEAIRFYSSANRLGVNRSLRKLKGRSTPHVVFNLTGESVKYFHYHSDEKDVSIDALMDDWPDDHAELGPKVEQAIRSMDPKVFDRLRDGLRDGVVVVLLPRNPQQRTAVFNTAERVLGQVPGEEVISLASPRVLLMHRGGEG